MTDYADPAKAASALNDPLLPPTDLQAIAAAQPELHATVAAHPAAYPDLLTWLDRVGDASVKAAVANRAAAPAPEPRSTAPVPTAAPAPEPRAAAPVPEPRSTAPAPEPRSTAPVPTAAPAPDTTASESGLSSEPNTTAPAPGPGLGHAAAPSGAPTYWLAPGETGPIPAQPQPTSAPGPTPVPPPTTVPPPEPVTAPLAWPAPSAGAPVSAPPTVTTWPQPGPAAWPTAPTTAPTFPPPAVGLDLGAAAASSWPGGFQATPNDPVPGATPLVPYTGGLAPVPVPRARRRRKIVAVGLAVALVAAAGVIGGVALVHDPGGLINAVSGPPTLTSQQFEALAQETLPDRSGRRPLTVHSPGGVSDDLLVQYCPGNTRSLQGATLEAGNIVGLRLKLFDNADAAEAYLDTLSSCMVQTGSGFVSTDKYTSDAVTLLNVRVAGIQTESFAAYGNVVAGGGLFQQDWPGFATGKFKPAVDEARTR